MEKNLTCIICPMGCRLQVTIENSQVINVSGNTCKRGIAYAETECINPKRVVTSTIRTADGNIIAVKTDKAIPKDMLFDCMNVINNTHPHSESGFNTGDILIKNILNTDADLVVTSNNPKTGGLS